MARTSTPGLSMSLGLPHNMVAKSQGQACQERVSQKEASVFYDLISEVIENPFCHIIFIRVR